MLLARSPRHGRDIHMELRDSVFTWYRHEFISLMEKTCLLMLLMVLFLFRGVSVSYFIYGLWKH